MSFKIIVLASVALALSSGCGTGIIKGSASFRSKGLERFENAPRYAGAQGHTGGYCAEYTSPESGNTVIIDCHNTVNAPLEAPPKWK
jgi:hypothetical protein